MSYATVRACTVFSGVRACVERMDGASLFTPSSLANAISYDGGAHGAPVKSKALEKLDRAIKTQKADAWFPVVGNEVAGGSVEYFTVQTLWDEKKQEFAHYPAIYGEDTSVFSKQSKAFRESTKGAENPKGIGLGTWFEEERIRHWTQNPALEAPYGLVPAARIGEYSPHSAAMIGIFNKLSARLGSETQGIREVDGRDVHPAWPMDVDTKKFVTPDGQDLNQVFLTNWSSKDGKQQLVASFTEGISTFTGDSVVRVQFTSNGNLPDKAILKDILASLLSAGQKEIDGRKWGLNSPIAHNTSPAIRLGGSNGELQISAFSVTGEEIAQRKKPEGAAASLMRIHTFEKDIIDALDAKTRCLGSHAMRPVMVDFANIPQEILGVAVPPAKPLMVAIPTLGVALH